MAGARPAQPCCIQTSLLGLSSQLGRTGPLRSSYRRMYFHRFVRTHRIGSYAAWYVTSAKIASLISSASPRIRGIMDLPCSHGGGPMSARSQTVGKRSTCETSASHTRPPVNPPGPRIRSITPMPGSVRWHFIAGKAMPWSVVQMTSVFLSSALASRAASTAPIWSSRARTLVLKQAMSRRVSGVSGRGAGGRQ